MAALRNRGRMVLAVLAILLAASMWRQTSVETDRIRLTKAYDEAAALVEELQAERKGLSSALRGSRRATKGQEMDLDGLQRELESVEVRLDEAMAEINRLRRAHEQMQKRNASLSAELDSVIDERSHLQAKLSSIKELKLAIKAVRRKIWSNRWARWRARRDQQREIDAQELAAGNHGLVVQQGYSTLGENPRLHVHVMEPEFPQ